ncbi:hypothetical protein IJH15_00135 [Candidatus Saccharibacteria bacterium]|nr:hypothetical protein [Candidatus Saccharibacteria bacterium]
MKTKLSKYLLIIVTCIFGLNLLVAPSSFAANDPICDNNNISDEIKAANGCKGTKAPKLENTIINIIEAIIAVLGVVAVIFIIIGGIQYMTSTGDPGKVKKAKDTILYALIGLAVCVLSFAIVNFVIKNVINYEPTTSEETPTNKQEGP